MPRRLTALLFLGRLVLVAQQPPTPAGNPNRATKWLQLDTHRYIRINYVHADTNT